MSMITVTDSAKQQVRDLCSEHKSDAVKLQVKGGGYIVKFPNNLLALDSKI